MGYTWTDGELITATKLNSTGVSVATVIVDFNDGGITGSITWQVYYAKYNSTLEAYSIEGFGSWNEGVSPTTTRFYTTVSLPSSTDNYKAFVFFPQYIDNIAGYTITGDISSTKVTGFIKTGSNQWNSTPYYGFEVTGNGEIDVYYND